MINIEKHIEHWREGSDEDFEVAGQLIRSNRIRRFVLSAPFPGKNVKSFLLFAL
jgi:hypothetical protein